MANKKDIQNKKYIKCSKYYTGSNLYGESNTYYEIDVHHPDFRNDGFDKDYYFKEVFEAVLSSKMELLFYVKKEHPLLDQKNHTNMDENEWNKIKNIEYSKTALARFVWDIMKKPYNFTFEEIQEAWNKFKKAKDL